MTIERILEYDRAYMGCAESIAKLSYAKRTKVGCVIVSKYGQIISQGFNGTPAGADNRCEDVFINGDKIDTNDITFERIVTGIEKNENWAKKYSLVTKDTVLHAESNAISKCAKWISTTDGATLYITLSPCKECAKLIIQAGIKKVVYKDNYRDLTGINFLKENGVEIEQI